MVFQFVHLAKAVELTNWSEVSSAGSQGNTEVGLQHGQLEKILLLLFDTNWLFFKMLFNIETNDVHGPHPFQENPHLEILF